MFLMFRKSFYIPSSTFYMQVETPYSVLISVNNHVLRHSASNSKLERKGTMQFLSLYVTIHKINLDVITCKELKLYTSNFINSFLN